MTTLFKRILIANRGEIACRVIGTARKLGIETVAVYSDADRTALHVRMADHAVHIGPSPAAESYLDAAKIIAAAQAAGAEAIHPGYGFLSENAGFAESCAAAGLVFIGPRPESIRVMGLKGAAKARMEAAGVPVVPGYHGGDQSPDRLLKEANAIGYPVLIKAVAGGGGKGMRRVDGEVDFLAALSDARSEAERAFGNGEVLLEKYLVKPRHIEVQVFGDRFGNAVHLFERDCSIQRRHQKVIEEAPAPGLSTELRAAFGDAAVRAAKAIAYEGAGTIEFICDVANGIDAAPFYFMEMNTRLQVEHPVTEMITGLDLVEWQLRVAAGQPLPRLQGEIERCGHAIEARLCAEDPGRDYMPSTGPILRFRTPESTLDFRVETGVGEGDAVSVFYDSMIAKLVVHAPDRELAAERLAAVLAATHIAGVETNSGMLRRILEHREFLDENLDTGFIERHRDVLIEGPARPAPEDLALAALCVKNLRIAAMRGPASLPGDPWTLGDSWRLNQEPEDRMEFRDAAGEVHAVDHAQIPSGTLHADGTVEGEIGGVRHRALTAVDGLKITLMTPGRRVVLERISHRASGDMDTQGPGAVVAPMPGRVLSVMACAGDRVTKGQPILVLEAMKMQHTLAAPRDGMLSEINAGEGDQVKDGVTLFIISEV